MGGNVTIGDVAREAGVTKGTVSLVYSGKRKISAETRQRVKEAADRLDWTPSYSARALATKTAGAVGIVLARDPRILATDAFFPAFLAGVEQSLAAHEMALSLQIVTGPDAEIRAYRRMSRGRADGVLLLDLELQDRRIDMVGSLGLPAVIIGDYGDTTSLTQIYADDRHSMRELLDHLIGLGHTRIAHVAGPRRYVHGHARRSAFVQHMDACGLDSSLVFETDFSAERGRAVTRELLDSDRPPTAICYANDLMAIAGMSYAHQFGCRIPDDLSLTGFDDSELSAQMSPGLTTVGTDAVARGARGAEALIDTINGTSAGRLELDCNRLIIRGSTGRAAR